MLRASGLGVRSSESPEIVAGRYLLTRRLARGGMGEVFAAVDQSTDTRVALKRMLPAAREQRSLVVHFMREYHALAELRHPRIIDVYDYGVANGLPYYTMELLDGADLRDLSPLPYREACAYLRDVASSLALLHARRLLHRDVSPRNVRRTSDGRCKLLDFGAMMPFGAPANITGTAPCVPPEALQGAPLDQRADLYALGALAYCTLTGRHAYMVSEFDQLPAAWKQVVVRPKRRVREIPDKLDELVMALLSLDPMKRPGSAAEVIDWLSAIAELPPDDSVAVARSFLTSSHIWGRDQERAELSRRLTTALSGQGSFILIHGEPGAGKSRMLAEAALVAQTCGLTAVRVMARRERGAAAALIAELVHGVRQAAPLEAQRAAARRPHVLALQQHGAAALQDQRHDGDSRRQTLSEVTEYIREVARERPLLVTVDDLDRADDSSTALVAALAHQTRNSPHVVIATHTAPLEHLGQGILTVAKRATRFSLAPLDRRHSELLVASLFGDVQNLDRVSDWLYRVAHGNPKLTLELAHHLMNRGVVRYEDGAWVVPSVEITEPLPQSMAEALMLRLSGVTPAALALAQLCCVRRGGVSAEVCLELVRRPSDEVFRSLEELVRAGVLESAGGEYAFAQDALREALERSLSAEQSRELHTRWSERLLAMRPQTLDVQLEAGWHLVHTDAELRGADLLARVGPQLVHQRLGMAAAIPAIEKALAVYEARGRPRSARLRLRSMLAMSSFLYDYRLAAAYGDATLEELYVCSGVADANRLAPKLGRRLAFLAGLTLAHFRWLFSAFRARGPNAFASLVYFIRTAMGLIGVRGVALDAQYTRGIAERFAVFERSPMPVLRMLHAMTQTVTLQNQGREREAHEAGHAALAKLDKPGLGMSRQEHADLLAGMLMMLGVNEGYREHSKALDYARRLEAIGTPLATSASHRVRMTYYIVRGDRERTQYYRRLLDLHALQGGTTWQVEWFAVAIEGLAGVAWTDLIAVRRTIARLEQLVHEVPSLLPMLQAMRVGYHFRRGEFAQAAELGLAWVARHPPRSIIGWGASYAITALSLVELDDPEQALQLAERGLAAVGDEDRAYFVMYSSLEVAQATALAVLGYRARADEIFRVRLARLRACGEHMRAFIIHEYRTKVARLIGDRPAMIEAVRDMREAALASGNASVIALADRVADLRARQRSSPIPPPQGEAPKPAAPARAPAATRRTPVPKRATGEMVVPAFLREVREPELRAQHALHMLGQFASGSEGYLYLVAGEIIQWAAALDETPPPAALEQQLGLLVHAGEGEDPVVVELKDSAGADRTYRIFRLRDDEVPQPECVAIVALRELVTTVEPVPQSLVDEIGRVLRAGGTALTKPPSWWPKAP